MNIINYKSAYILLSLFLFSFCSAAFSETADELIYTGIEFSERGDFEHAAISWKQAADILDKEAHPELYLDTVMHLAGAYQSLGYHERSLAVLQEALPFAEKSDDHKQKALFLNMLGDLCFSVGDIEGTFNHMMKALEEAGAAEDPLTMAKIMLNAGNVFSSEKDYPRALMLYKGAFDLAQKEKGAPDLIVNSLMNFARASFLSDSAEDALMILDYTLGTIIEMDDSHDKAKYLISVALLIRDIQKKSNQPKDDLTYLTWQALEEAKIIGQNLEDPRITSYAYGYLGQMYEDQGTYEAAMTLTRSAVFFARQGNYPQIAYLWHWQLARLFKARGDVENAIAAYQQSIEILNPIRKELFKGYRSRGDIFNEKVKPVYLGLTGILLEQAETIADSGEQEATLIQARDVMELLKTAEIQDFFEDECVTEAKKKIKPIDRTPPHTAVIYPITLPERLALLLTLPDGLKQVNVPVGSEEIKETVARFRHGLQNRTNNRFLYESRQLYDWLIRPVESELNEYKVHTLVVAPDGALRMIPFSAMNDGTQFLVEKYAIATVPAISLTDLKPPDPSKFEILLSGLSESVQGASPLPSVPKELRDIKEIMNGKVLLQDKEHTAANLTREFKKQPYSIVHLATHGVFGGTPKESFLLMYDSLLTMDLLENLISISRFRNQPVELLTLSACQTAMGNERAALGLAGVAVKAGVRSAIATLWYVDDEATSLAIREFYRQLKTPGISKVEALRNAQKKLISQPRYWHPLYWAPFLLIGNWL